MMQSSSSTHVEALAIIINTLGIERIISDDWIAKDVT